MSVRVPSRRCRRSISGADGSSIGGDADLLRKTATPRGCWETEASWVRRRRIPAFVRAGPITTRARVHSSCPGEPPAPMPLMPDGGGALAQRRRAGDREGARRGRGSASTAAGAPRMRAPSPFDSDRAGDPKVRPRLDHIIEQRGLADARLAVHRQHAAAAVARRLQHAVEHVAFRAAVRAAAPPVP
jgi:hypothetical protein